MRLFDRRGKRQYKAAFRRGGSSGRAFLATGRLIRAGRACGLEVAPPSIGSLPGNGEDTAVSAEFRARDRGLGRFVSGEESG